MKLIKLEWHSVNRMPPPYTGGFTGLGYRIVARFASYSRRDR